MMRQSSHYFKTRDWCLFLFFTSIFCKLAKCEFPFEFTGRIPSEPYFAKLGAVEADDIHYLLIEDIRSYKNIFFYIITHFPLKVLFRYGGLPTPLNYDFIFDVRDLPAAGSGFIISNILSALPPPNYGLAATDNLVAGIWGGSDISSIKYLTGDAVSLPYEVHVLNQKIDSGKPMLKLHRWRPSGDTCINTSASHHASAVDTVLLPLSFDTPPEMVHVSVSISVVSTLNPVSLEGWKACLKPATFVFSSLAEICTDNILLMPWEYVKGDIDDDQSNNTASIPTTSLEDSDVTDEEILSISWVSWEQNSAVNYSSQWKSTEATNVSWASLATSNVYSMLSNSSLPYNETDYNGTEADPFMWRNISQPWGMHSTDDMMENTTNITEQGTNASANPTATDYWKTSVAFNLTSQRLAGEQEWQLVIIDEGAQDAQYMSLSVLTLTSQVCMEALFCQDGYFGFDESVFVDLARKRDFDSNMLGSSRSDNTALLCPIEMINLKKEQYGKRLMKEFEEYYSLKYSSSFQDITFEEDYMSLGGERSSVDNSNTVPLYFQLKDVDLRMMGGTLTISISIIWNLDDADLFVKEPTVDDAPTVALYLAPSSAMMKNISEQSIYSFKDKAKLLSSGKVSKFSVEKEFVRPRFLVSDGLVLRLDISVPSRIPGYALIAAPTLDIKQCSDSMCPSSKGNCVLRTIYDGISYDFCDCYYPYMGETCNELRFSPSSFVTQVSVLFLSNYTMCVGIYLALRKGLFGFSTILFFTMVTSSLYHLCDIEAHCVFGFTSITWQVLDVFLTYKTIFSVAIFLAYMPKKKQGLAHSLGSIISIFLSIIRINRAFGMIIMFSLCCLMLFVCFTFECKKRRHGISFVDRTFPTTRKIFGFITRKVYWQDIRYVLKDILKDWNWVLALFGIASLVSATCTFIFQDPEKYWIMHSLWHVLSMSAVTFFILSRRKINPEHMVDTLLDISSTRPASSSNSSGRRVLGSGHSQRVVVKEKYDCDSNNNGFAGDKAMEPLSPVSCEPDLEAKEGPMW